MPIAHNAASTALTIGGTVRTADFTATSGTKETVDASQAISYGVLTFTAAPSNNDTIVIGSTTYTYKTAAPAAANDVLIGATSTTARDNLIAAITAGAGSGTTYGVGTVAHTAVTASTGLVGISVKVTALLAATVGATVATTETSTNASWSAVELIDMTITPPTGQAGARFGLVDSSYTDTGKTIRVDFSTAKINGTADYYEVNDSAKWAADFVYVDGTVGFLVTGGLT